MPSPAARTITAAGRLRLTRLLGAGGRRRLGSRGYPDAPHRLLSSAAWPRSRTASLQRAAGFQLPHGGPGRHPSTPGSRRSAMMARVSDDLDSGRARLPRPDDREGASRPAGRDRAPAVRREGPRGHLGRGDRREGRRVQAGRVRALRRQGGAVRRRRGPGDAAAAGRHHRRAHRRTPARAARAGGVRAPGLHRGRRRRVPHPGARLRRRHRRPARSPASSTTSRPRSSTSSARSSRRAASTRSWRRCTRRCWSAWWR